MAKEDNDKHELSSHNRRMNEYIFKYRLNIHNK